MKPMQVDVNGDLYECPYCGAWTSVKPWEGETHRLVRCPECGLTHIISFKTPVKEVCCSGCRHLDYWNDGSALCVKGLEGVCIPNGFKYREVNE